MTKDAEPQDAGAHRPLSIIMPVLNEEAGIGPRIADLATLRESGADIIVVDGSSHDATCANARAYADLVLQAPRGRAAQMNFGAARASGDVLLFLHADTRLPDSAFTDILAALADPRQVWGRFDVTIAGRHPLLPVVAAFMNIRSRWTGIATGDQGMFVRRVAFVAVGGFPDIALMEDIALSARLRRLARPVCLRTRVQTSGRRWDDKGFWRTVLLMWALRAAYALGASPAVLARLYGYR